MSIEQEDITLEVDCTFCLPGLRHQRIYFSNVARRTGRD